MIEELPDIPAGVVGVPAADAVARHEPRWVSSGAPDGARPA